MTMESPIDAFRREHFQHAERITRAVHEWYQFAAKRFIINAPTVLKSTTGRFLQTTLNNPDEVYITNTPLSFALEQKRKVWLEKFKNIPPSVYIKRFGDWFNRNLTNDSNPIKRQSIEQLAALHVFSWVASLPSNFKHADSVWDQVDANLTQISQGKMVNVHPTSSVLMSCIQFAVVEQFMTDEYAPTDLFGGTRQN